MRQKSLPCPCAGCLFWQGFALNPFIDCASSLVDNFWAAAGRGCNTGERSGRLVQGMVTQLLLSQEQNLTLVLGENKQCPCSQPCGSISVPRAPPSDGQAAPGRHTGLRSVSHQSGVHRSVGQRVGKQKLCWQRCPQVPTSSGFSPPSSPPSSLLGLPKQALLSPGLSTPSCFPSGGGLVWISGGARSLLGWVCLRFPPSKHPPVTRGCRRWHLVPFPGAQRPTANPGLCTQPAAAPASPARGRMWGVSRRLPWHSRAGAESQREELAQRKQTLGPTGAALPGTCSLSVPTGEAVRSGRGLQREEC